MTFNSNKPIDDTVSSVTEFGIGAILRLVFTIIIIGVLALVAFGGTETSAGALLVGLLLIVGAFIGMIGMSLFTWSSPDSSE